VMKSKWLGVCAVVLLAPIPFVRADDKADDEVSKAFSKIAALGPGVHAIKRDAKGRITSCVVVGQSRISTVLGKAKGLEVARTRARVDASAQFSRGLKGKVGINQKS